MHSYDYENYLHMFSEAKNTSKTQNTSTGSVKAKCTKIRKLDDHRTLMKF